MSVLNKEQVHIFECNRWASNSSDLLDTIADREKRLAELIEKLDKFASSLPHVFAFNPLPEGEHRGNCDRCRLDAILDEARGK